MKKVILHSETCEVTTLDTVTELNYYITKWKNDYYVAVKTGMGWIFRYVDASSGGLNGYYTSLRELLEYNIKKDFVVYEFSTFQKAAEYVMS